MKYLYIIILLLIFTFACGKREAPYPKSVKGVIDLSWFSFEKDKVLPLEGEWEFYWNRALTPEDFFDGTYEGLRKGYVYGPSGWNSFIDPYHPEKGKIGSYGTGTYVLKISNLEKVRNTTFAVYLKNSGSSYKLYVFPSDVGDYKNIKPLMAGGVVDLDPEKYVPYLLPQTKPLGSISKNNYIVLQVSNHSANNGGMWDPIYFGKHSDVLKMNESEKLFDGVVLGILFIMFLYHVSLYIQRREDNASLLFGLFCIINVFRMLSTDKYFFEYFDKASFLKFEIFFKLEFITIYFGAPVLYHFLKSLFKEDFYDWFKKYIWIISIIFIIEVLIFSSKVYSTLNNYYIFLGIFPVAVMITISVIKAALNKRVGGQIILFGWFFFVFTIVSDALIALGVLTGIFLTPVGFISFIFGKSYIISKRFSKAYRDLAETTKEKVSLEELDKQKTIFFQNISHELRTPLTLILNPAEEAFQKYKDTSLEMISKNARRLFRLVNQLLDFQKSRSGKKDLTYSPININEFLLQVSKNFTTYCDSKNINFTYISDYDNDVYILGVVDSLEKIVFNYLSNALKYTPESGNIQLGLVKKDDSTCRILVRDNGEGISKINQKKLFTVFSQVDGGERRAFEGTGLGLALVKELTIELKGEVGVESNPGEGSLFYADFPIFKIDKKVIDLLVVDDDESILSIFESNLAKAKQGITFELASNTKEAKGLLEDLHFKSIVSDIVMSKESGFDLLRFVKDAYPSTERYLMTGKADRDILDEITGGGLVKKIFYKPLDFSEILGEISVVTDDNSKASLKEVDLKDYVPKGWLVENTKNEKTDDIEEGEMKDLNGPSVLVVDDLRDMRDLISNILVKNGYKVIKARDGEEGIEKAKKYIPDLIVTDWMMPNKSGLDLIHEMKKDVKTLSIPTVLLTAKSDEESKLIGSKMGASAYIGKPFDELELTSTVSNLLSLKSRENEVIKLNKELSENVLKRFLPPYLVDNIVTGKERIDDNFKTLNVTVLFADICSFTKISSDLGPKNVARVLNNYLEEMSKIIFEFNGTIDKIVGDSIMALWGAPVGMRGHDQVEKAYKCALKIQKRLGDFNKYMEEENLPKISVRIGIDHGAAIVGYFGGRRRTDYTAIGTTVNKASRIESIAEPGEIYISTEVRDFLPDDTNWERVGVFELKGISDNENVYKIIK